MRGLKLFIKSYTTMRKYVASFTDAWIETKPFKIGKNFTIVASFTDAWIETIRTSSAASPEIVASFTDAWIETF